MKRKNPCIILQRMAFLPRDEKFFDLLAEQARIASEASTVLVRTLSGNPQEPIDTRSAAQIRKLEQNANALRRDIHRRLLKTFITPLDPEDIHTLAARVDKVIDRLEIAAYRLDAFCFKCPPPRAGELVRIMDTCVQRLRAAMDTLRRDGLDEPDELSRNCEEINRLEREAEEKVRQAVRELLASERDPTILITTKDFYESIDAVGDSCERTADVLEEVAVKNT